MYWIENKSHNWSIDGNNLQLSQRHFIIEIKLVINDEEPQYKLKVCDSERQLTGIIFDTIEGAAGYAEEVCKTCQTLEEAEAIYQELFSSKKQIIPRLTIKNRYSDYNGTERIDEEPEKTLTQRIFEETGRLGNAITKNHEQLDNLNMQCIAAMNECPHEIVFKYRDNHPRILPIEGDYFCPACGMTIRSSKPGNIQNSSFANSRVIPLTNLSLLGTKDNYQIIRQEVYDNLGLYYDPNANVAELSRRMEELLKDRQYDYQNAKDALLKNSSRQRTRKDKDRQ